MPPDPVAHSYFGLPGYFHLWVLTLVSFVVFGRRIWRHVILLLRARPENRWDCIGSRIGLVATYVLGQRRLFDEPLIGAAHFVIFWSFVAYATTFFWNLLRGLIPTLAVPYPDDVAWVAGSIQVLGVLGLVALAVAAARRYLFPPARLERSWDASIILFLIAVVLLSSLCNAGFRALAFPEGSGRGWQVAGNTLGAMFTGLGATRTQAPGLLALTWWIHMITVLGFLAYLPYSKHLHLLASPFSVFFASLKTGKMPPASEGASRLEEFTWRELFTGLACAECGRCDRACPNVEIGSPFSPKQLVHCMKELVLASNGNGSASDDQTLLGGKILPEDVWRCTTCGSCMEVCPVFNEHIALIVELRRKLITQGSVQPSVQDAFTNLARYGNSFGLSERKRAVWTQNLGFKPADARKQPVQWLWYLGEYASYHPAVQSSTCSLARSLAAAGLDFGILYEAERNSGNDVRRVGEEGLFELLRQKNTAALSQARFNNLFTTDPHVYNTFKNEYPDLNHGRHVVLHYTELLASLFQGGQLHLRRTLPYRVTYHDPCYLGRYNGIYDPPRAVLKALGVELLEMQRSRRQSFCCGGGGGSVWMEETAKSHSRPSEIRVREAAKLEGVQYLVVACPKDNIMFTDALKTTGLEGKLAVKDLGELVEEATAA